MRDKFPLIGGALLVIILIASASLFTVDQRQHAMVFQLGEIKEVIDEPGLKFKLPLIQNVRYFDKRILTMDTPEPERFITSEKKNVLVDHFVKWRIVDPRLYYESVAGDEARARTRLTQTVNAGLREEFGRRTVHDVVSGERDRIMDQMRERADRDARTIGVQIVDVRLKRVDLPNEVSESVYHKIRADADRQREVIVAEAYRSAQQVKGEGDAKATAIYAEAFGKNPSFYSFYRSLEAYRASFAGKDDVLVVDPSSDFFRFMKDAGGSARN